ncbi:hypothetical protein C8R42DRAFT_717373 [Lentinula raphanica]|nr:hypothetical protein C8R42DRAFT_717373 [Lentinula raphanica]
MCQALAYMLCIRVTAAAVDELDSQVDELASQVDELASQVDELASQVDELASQVDELACAGGSHPSRHEDNVMISIPPEEASISPAEIHHDSTPELRESTIAASDETTLTWPDSVVISSCALQNAIRLCKVMFSWVTSLAYSFRAQITFIATELSALFERQGNSWVTRSGVHVFAPDYYRRLPPVRWVIIVLKLKMVVDRLILDVSHHYLGSEFRQMLRHDAERWIVL